MRAVTVYRVDYARKTRNSVGVVLEQRETERGNNYKDLLRLARRQFALETGEAVNIVIDVSHARRAYVPDLTSDCAVGQVRRYHCFANSCRLPWQCDLSAIANRLKDTTEPGV